MPLSPPARPHGCKRCLGRSPNQRGRKELQGAVATLLLRPLLQLYLGPPQPVPRQSYFGQFCHGNFGCQRRGRQYLWLQPTQRKQAIVLVTVTVPGVVPLPLLETAFWVLLCLVAAADESCVYYEGDSRNGSSGGVTEALSPACFSCVGAASTTLAVVTPRGHPRNERKTNFHRDDVPPLTTQSQIHAVCLQMIARGLLALKVKDTKNQKRYLSTDKINGTHLCAVCPSAKCAKDGNRLYASA